MIKSYTIFAYFSLVFLIACGNTTNQNEAKGIDLTEKVFSFGIFPDMCDGLTISEYAIFLKFYDKDSVRSIYSDAMNMGEEDSHLVYNIQKGTYKQSDSIFTLIFTKEINYKVYDKSPQMIQRFDIGTVQEKYKLSTCVNGNLQLVLQDSVQVGHFALLTKESEKYYQYVKENILE